MADPFARHHLLARVPVIATIDLTVLINDDIKASLHDKLSVAREAIIQHSGAELVRLPNIKGDRWYTFYFLRKAEKKSTLNHGDLMQIELIDEKSNRIRVVIRKDNIYLIGFCTSNGGFFEMKSEDGQKESMMKGATFLPHVDCGYGHIFTFDENNTHMGVTDVFSWKRLDTAILGLNGVQEIKGQKIEKINLEKEDIGIITIMFIEGTRFPHFLAALTGGIPMSLGTLSLLVTDWGKGSKQLWKFRIIVESGKTLSGDEFGSVCCPTTICYTTILEAGNKIRVINYELDENMEEEHAANQKKNNPAVEKPMKKSDTEKRENRVKNAIARGGCSGSR